MVRHLKKSHNGAELVPDQQEQEQQAATNNNDETGLDQEPSKLANTKSDLPNPTSQAAIVPNVLDVSTVNASETTRVVFTGFNDNQDNDDEDDFRFGCDQCWFAAETAVQLSEHVLAKHPIVELTESDQQDNLTKSVQQDNLANETSEKINPVSDKASNEIIVETVPSSTQTKLVATEVVSSTQTRVEADSIDLEVVELVSQSHEGGSEPSEKKQKSTEIVSNTFETKIINNDTSNEESTVIPNQSSTESMFEDDDETDSRFQCNLCWFASETNEELSNHIKTNHESNLGDETEMEEEKNKTSTINEPAKVIETSNKSPEVVEQPSEAEMEIAKTKTGISCKPQENVQSSNLHTSDIEIFSNESKSIKISNKLPEIVELLDEDDNVKKDSNLTEVFQPKEIDIDSTLTISNEDSMIKDGDKEVSEKMDQTTPACLIVCSVAQSNESVEEPSETVKQATLIDLEATETVQQPTVIDLESTETVQQPAVIDLESTETVQQPTDPLASSTSLQNVDCLPMDIENELNNEDPLQSNEHQEDQNMDQEMEVETNQSKSASDPIQVPETSESSKVVPEVIDISSMETTEVVAEVFNEVHKDSELDLASESSQFSTEIDDKMDLFFEAPKMAPESSQKGTENSEMEMSAESSKDLTDKNAETELFFESSEMVTDAYEVVTDVSKISDSEKAFSIDCNLCDFSTFEFDKMETHLGWEGHFALGQENLCQHCTYMSATKEDLLEHGKTHFEDFALAAFVCCKCEHISKSQDQIEEHVKEAH
jgi:hypothetical protein